MKDPVLEAYVDRIEREFFRAKGRPGSLTPEDFALAVAWFRDGVALEDVVEGVAAAFEARTAGRDAGIEEVNSLSFCEPHIASVLERRRGPR